MKKNLRIKKLEQIRDEFKPTHVIHCDGVCDLDVCEDRPKWAFAILTFEIRGLFHFKRRDREEW